MALIFQKPGENSVVRLSKPRKLVEDQQEAFTSLKTNLSGISDPVEAEKVMSDYLHTSKQTRTYKSTMDLLRRQGYAEVNAEAASDLLSKNR